MSFKTFFDYHMDVWYCSDNPNIWKWIYDSTLYYKVRNLFWAFNHRFVKKHKYNTVYTDLKPGYYDIDQIFIGVVKSLIIRYVEIENDNVETFYKKILDQTESSDEIDKENLKINSDIWMIYKWFKTDRDQEIQKNLDYLHNKIPWGERKFFGSNSSKIDFSSDYIKHMDEYITMEDRVDRTDDEMVKKFCTIYRCLWT